VRHRRREAGAALEYRGPDRRREVETAAGLRALRPAIALVVTAAVWAAVTLALGDETLRFGSVALRTRLEIAGGALAVFAGGICVLRWHLEGSAPSLRLGAGLFVLGVPGIALVAPGDRSDETTAAALAALWVAAALFARAMRGPEVDEASSPVLVFAATLASLAAAFVVASVVVALTGPIALVEVVTGLGYLALAATGAERVRRPGFADGSWLISVLAAVAVATIMWALASGGAGLLALGAALLRCAAFGLAAAGSVGVLSVSAVRHRSRAFRSQVEHAEEAELRRHLEEDHAELLHEVRSSVLALHGGVRTLEPAAEADARLAQALEAELTRLQELVAPDERATPGIPFSVEEALVPTLRVCEAAGWPVVWQIPAGLCAQGRPARCAQVVHALVANANLHAAGSPIDVTACGTGGHVTIRVEDRGPGVERGRRELIFERGIRGEHDRDGLGLGLAIARRLVREQGGDLWVEARPGGGAAFVLSLDAGDRRVPAARDAVTGLSAV
jgi:signal transduction histidine kinase